MRLLSWMLERQARGMKCRKASPSGVRSRVWSLKVGSHALVLLAGESVDLLVGVGGKQLAPVVAEGHAADVDTWPALPRSVSTLC